MTERKAKMPSTVQVGPYRYEIQVEKSADAGQMMHEGQKITVAPENGPDARADTLLHEVLHAHFVLLGLRKDLTEKQEERIILSLAPLLLDTLRRNPALVSYLVDA